MNIVDFVDWQF